MLVSLCFVCFFKRKTAYDVRISDWSSDVCSSDLGRLDRRADAPLLDRGGEDLVAAAEAFDESVRPRLFGESREIGEVAGEAARDAPRPGGAEERGEDAVARAPAAEGEGLLDVLGAALPVGDPGCRLGGDGKQVRMGRA